MHSKEEENHSSKLVQKEIEITIFANIERHLWLECHETQFVHTLVTFSNFLFKSRLFLTKMIIVHSLKILTFNRSPPLYIRGYGRWIKIFLTCCKWSMVDTWGEVWKQSNSYFLHCLRLSDRPSKGRFMINDNSAHELERVSFIDKQCSE